MAAATAGAAAAGTPVRGAAASRGARPPGTGRSCDDLRRAGDGGDGGDGRGGGSRPRHGGCAKSPSDPGSPGGAPTAERAVVAVAVAVPAAVRNASDDSGPGTRPYSLPRP